MPQQAPSARKRQLFSRGLLLALSLCLGLGLSAASAQRESTLVTGGDFSDLITLDPGVFYEFSGSLVTGNLYDTLVIYEGNDLKTLKPRLASSWTVTTTATGSRITFKLRDAKFSSGRPVTAADVIYSLTRVIALKTPSSFLLTDVANITAKSLSAPDAKTVVMDIPKTANPNIVLALLGPLLVGSPSAQDLGARLSPPSAAHPLGIDQLGRDVLTRVLSGARISLGIGVSVMLASLLVGSAAGLVAGLLGDGLRDVFDPRGRA